MLSNVTIVNNFFESRRVARPSALCSRHYHAPFPKCNQAAPCRRVRLAWEKSGSFRAAQPHSQILPQLSFQYSENQSQNPNRMKIQLVLIAIILATCAHAQTNQPIIFDRLLSCSNTVLMTNAEFRVVGSKDRIFFLSGDAYRFFTPSQLNSNVLSRIGISQAKLKARADAEAKREASFAAEQAAIADYRYELSTNVKVIRVFSTDGLNCQTSLGDLVLKNLPGMVSGFLSQKEQLQTEIQDTENWHPTVTTVVTDPNDPDPAGTAEFLNQEKINELIREKKNKLDDLHSRLQELQLDEADHTTVRAYFTGSQYGGMEVWECIGMSERGNIRGNSESDASIP